MLLKIESFLKKYGIYLLVGLCLVLGLLSLKFRNSTLDDDLYLFETSIMTDVLQKGEWIGNYAVGVHGFLFKLPVAIVFLLTGPVMNIAVAWNILIACASLYLFYIILKEYFRNDLISLSGTLLLFTNFQFLLNLPTYMREMPVLFSVLLFMYFLIKKKSYWLIGLSLLLILEAKESVFFMILPGYLISVAITEWSGFRLRNILKYFISYSKVLVPSVVFLLMMLFTQLIPLNTVIFTLIPGVTKGGVEYQLEHFEKNAATQNIVQLQNLEAANVNTLILEEIEGKQTSPEDDKKAEEKSIFYLVFKIGLEYLGKILYPRTFSFLSIPGIIFFPAFLVSIYIIREAIKKKNNILISFSLIMWAFITVYILRQSFDRYLFPITPLVLFFFLVFLKDTVKYRKEFLTIWTISSLLSLVSLLFEAEYIMIKFGLTAIAITILALYQLFKEKRMNLHFFVCILLSILTFGVGLFYYYSSGQLRSYILFGNDYEVEKVVSYFSKDEKVMLNDVGWDLLPGIYRGNNQYNPEWKWELNDWIPRKKYLKMLNTTNTFLMSGESIDADKAEVEKYKISKIGIVQSKIDNKPFIYQSKIEKYLKSDWLILVKIVELKNKELYVFEVKEIVQTL